MPRKAHVSLMLYLPSGLTSGFTAVIILSIKIPTLADISRILADQFTLKCKSEYQPGCEQMTRIFEPSHDSKNNCYRDDDSLVNSVNDFD
jgi:hypothetical protein